MTRKTSFARSSRASPKAWVWVCTDANLAMELNGGELAFPQPGAIEISDEFSGAAVALIFREKR